MYSKRFTHASLTTITIAALEACNVPVEEGGEWTEEKWIIDEPSEQEQLPETSEASRSPPARPIRDIARDPAGNT